MEKETILVEKVCMLCGKPNGITVSLEGYNKWKVGGMFVQDAFPELTADEREVLISGSHPDCFDEAFAEDD